MSKRTRGILLFLICAAFIFALISCGDGETTDTGDESSVTAEQSDQSSATNGQTSDKTQTADPNRKPFTMTGKGGVKVETRGEEIKVSVPNETVAFSVNDYVETREDVLWEVYKDPEGTQEIRTKRLSLTEGTNIYYISVFDKSTGALLEDYTLTIVRSGTYTVSFEGITEKQTVVEGGKAKEPSGSLVPVKDGCTFDGWDFDFSTPITGDVTVPAKWVPKTYTITYLMKQADMEDQTQQVAFGEDTVLLKPECAGYTFIGWSLYNDNSADGMGGEPVTDGPWTIAENVMLVANWEVQRVQIHVTLNPNGGTVNGLPDAFEMDVEFGKDKTFPKPMLEGYTFVGWFYGEGEDDHFESGVFNFTEDMIFTAQWAELSTRIKFYENGGEGGEYEKILKFVGDVLPTPVREGFTFGGWFFDVDLTEQAFSVPQDTENTVVLYAWWSEEGKPGEFVYSLYGTSYLITERIDPTSVTLVPAFIGGLPTIDEVVHPNDHPGIVLEKGDITSPLKVKVDRTVQIRAIYTPRYDTDDTRLFFVSSNERIATVDQTGLVTGVAFGLGMCTVTVSNVDGSFTATCYIMVSNEVKNPNAGVQFVQNKIQLYVGEQSDPGVEYLPEYADDDRTLVFTSGNESIATVDAEGVITGVALGKCTITVRSLDGRYSASCFVTVTNVKTNDNAGLFLSDNQLDMNVGWVKTVIADYTPLVQGADTTVLWESSDESVATVDNGVITAVGEGTCMIIVGDVNDEYVEVVNVTVRVPGIYIERADETLLAGSEGVFKAFVLPENENGSTEVIYFSSNNAVATVNAGVITAKAKGECELTAISADGLYFVTVQLKVLDIFEISGDDVVKVEARRNNWYITVTTDDLTFLHMDDYVSINAPGYQWKLSHDVEMNNVVPNKNVSVPVSGELIYYAHLMRADGTFVSTYGLHITKSVEYTVTLDPNGGEVSQTVITVKSGELFTLPVPSLDGYSFDGWYYNQQYFDKTRYDLSTSITLVAHYTKKQSDPTVTPTDPTPAEPESIELSDFTLRLNVGDQVELTAAVLPENVTNKKLTYAVSDGSVVSYENGLVTAYAAGEATITFTAYNGVEAKCSVIVEESTLTDGPWKLHKTANAGDGYASSVVFVGEALTSGSQVWLTSSGSPLLFSEMRTAKIIYPATGAEITIAQAAALARPAYLCLTFGATALLDQSCTKNLFIEQYSDFIKDISAASPDTVVIVQSALPVLRTLDARFKGINNDKILVVNSWIAGMVAELHETNANVYYLDSNALMAENTGILKHRFNTGDGFSINETGYKELLSIVKIYAVTLQ